ncbi:hypothetical protein OFL77_27235, partial [Escherichia coli]|uniref:hypothetical protein n=1 Tax=Escherichia coli TaxID=562 RepID=UPI0021DF7DDC
LEEGALDGAVAVLVKKLKAAIEAGDKEEAQELLAKLIKASALNTGTAKVAAKESEIPATQVRKVFEAALPDVDKDVLASAVADAIQS